MCKIYVYLALDNATFYLMEAYLCVAETAQVKRWEKPYCNSTDFT